MIDSAIDAQYESLLRELTLLCRAVGAGDEAEDLAQETILNGRDKVSQLRDGARLRAWLRHSAVRRVRAYQRRSWRLVAEDALTWAPIDHSLPIDLRAAIARLPRRERHALTLVYGLGYSQAEVADALGVSRGTIASSLFRARRKLAQTLVDYARHEGYR